MPLFAPYGSSAKDNYFPVLLAALSFIIPVSGMAQPVISSFSPASGPVGTSVTIAGTNFSTTPADNIVFFGAVQATVTDAGSTSLTVTVPVGASYQPISVTTASLTGYSNTPFIVSSSVGGGSVFTSGFFDPKIDSTTDESPYGTAVGDLDGDGKADIAVSSRNSACISLYRNIITAPGAFTTGSFEAKVDFNVGSNAWRVAIADIDGDGKPDIAVADAGAAKVSVFRNTMTSGVAFSSASLDSKIDYATGSTPQSIVINDLDGDNQPDLVIGNTSSNSVSVLRNNIATVLPLQSLDFSGIAVSGQITLNWQTTGELNTAFFQVEYGTNGVDFARIETVPAANNAAGVTNYHFTHREPAAGYNYYRLKMTDMDGRYTYSYVIRIGNIAGTSGLRIYPNPAVTAVQINMPVSDREAQIRLVNISGEIVRSIMVDKNTSSVKMSLTGVRPGVYTVIWSNGNNKRQIQKLVVR